MNPERDTLDLLLRHAGDETSAAETAELSRRLRADAAARESLRELALQAIAISEEAGAGNAAASEPTARKIVALPRRSMFWAAGLAAALVILLGLAAWRMNHGKTPGVAEFTGPAVATLAEVAGAVWFREEGGSELHEARAGMELPAGVLITRDSLAAARLRFADGTELALASDTELAFADDGQKRLRVESGAVSAQVRPQPPGRPLLIRTSTAEMQVVGTIFSIATQPESTRLEVESGAVKMTRLADGQSVEVRQDSSAVALASPVGKFSAESRAALPQSWRVNFDRGLPKGWKLGRWMTEQTADGGTQGFVQAVIEPEKGERKKPNHIVGTVNAWSGGNTVLAALRDDSVLRMTVRKARPGGLHLVVCVRSLDRDRPSLGGDVLMFENFPDWKALPIGEWGELAVPLKAFTRRDGERTATARAKGVFYIAITTYDRDLGLELRSISIE